jgi:diguanylate cyclase (GGDEF)-like protein
MERAVPKNKTEKIQRIIRIYSLVTVVLIAFTVTILAIYPLYSLLRETEKRDLVFARDTSVLIVDEYVSRIKDIAKQISSRTKARILLEEYQAQKITRQQMQSYLRTILQSALQSSTQLIGITRMDSKGEIMASVGKPITSTFLPKTNSQSEIAIHGPFIRDKHYYLTITSPIWAPNNQLVGQDISLFDITDLQSSIHKKLQYRLGEILIAYIDNNKLNIFSPLDTPWRSLLQSNNPLVKSLTNAISQHHQGLVSGNVGDSKVIISYAPIHQTNWGIAVIIKHDELFSSVQKILWVILFVIAAVTLIFTAGLGMCLRPLSGKLILQHQELQDEINLQKSELALANTQLKHLVDHDALTGIKSRRAFETALLKEHSRAKRNHESFGLLYIDVNNFKLINDNHGHEAGDSILKSIAERLVHTLRTEDTIARVGGDEFAVIIPCATSENIAAIANKVMNLTRLPINYHNKLIECSVSIGYACYPDDSSDIDQLMRQADHNMYNEKRRNQ